MNSLSSPIKWWKTLNKGKINLLFIDIFGFYNFSVRLKNKLQKQKSKKKMNNTKSNRIKVHLFLIKRQSGSDSYNGSSEPLFLIIHIYDNLI